MNGLTAARRGANEGSCHTGPDLSSSVRFLRTGSVIPAHDLSSFFRRFRRAGSGSPPATTFLRSFAHRLSCKRKSSTGRYCSPNAGPSGKNFPARSTTGRLPYYAPSLDTLLRTPVSPTGARDDICSRTGCRRAFTKLAPASATVSCSQPPPPPCTKHSPAPALKQRSWQHCPSRTASLLAADNGWGVGLCARTARGGPAGRPPVPCERTKKAVPSCSPMTAHHPPVVHGERSPSSSPPGERTKKGRPSRCGGKCPPLPRRAGEPPTPAARHRQPGVRPAAAVGRPVRRRRRGWVRPVVPLRGCLGHPPDTAPTPPRHRPDTASRSRVVPRLLPA